MSDHTPGPWRAVPERLIDGHHVAGRSPTVVSGNGALVAKTARRGVKDGPDPDAEANARRICAAVNAVRGIPTEALEAGAVAELLAAAEGVAGWLQDRALYYRSRGNEDVANGLGVHALVLLRAVQRARTEAPPA